MNIISSQVQTRKERQPLGLPVPAGMVTQAFPVNPIRRGLAIHCGRSICQRHFYFTHRIRGIRPLSLRTT